MEFSEIKSKEQDSRPVGNRKRHTTRSITCPSVTCSGGYPSLGGGTISWPGRGYSILIWLGEYPSCPGWGVPYPDLAGGTPSWDWGTPGKGPRLSHWGNPQKGHGTSESIMGWRWGTTWVWTDKQTENITSCHTSYAGGKYQLSKFKTDTWAEWNKSDGKIFKQFMFDICCCGRLNVSKVN